MEALLRQLMRGATLRLCAIVWLFGYVLVDLTAALQGRSPVGLMLLANVPLMLLGIAQSVALGLLFDRLPPRLGRMRWGIVAAAGLVAAAIQTAADHVLLAALSLTLLPEWQSWALGVEPARKFAILILYLWTIYLTLALTWALRTSDAAKFNDARAAAFAAAAARAEAAALRLQLNPHFLFNTLNGIASLVVRDRQDEAEDMIGRLADFLRSSLAADPTALVPLAQEVETVRAYLAIESARFGPRLTVNYDIAPELAGQDVPNFILQPLVENAIQHGVAKSRHAVRLTVAAQATPDGPVLSVVNRSGAGPEPVVSAENALAASVGHGIGLANTRSRLAAQYGGTAWLECRPLADGYRVEIGLPGPVSGMRAA